MSLRLRPRLEDMGRFAAGVEEEVVERRKENADGGLKGRPVEGAQDRYRHTADLYRQDVNLSSRQPLLASIGNRPWSLACFPGLEVLLGRRDPVGEFVRFAVSNTALSFKPKSQSLTQTVTSHQFTEYLEYRARFNPGPVGPLFFCQPFPVFSCPDGRLRATTGQLPRRPAPDSPTVSAQRSPSSTDIV